MTQGFGPMMGLAFLLVGGAWSAIAAGHGEVAVGVAGKGDVANGKAIAVGGTPSGAPACGGCHGASGEGQDDAGVPRLAGLNELYLEHQLAAFAAGTRENAVMGPIAGTLKPAAMADVAAYYASLAAPGTGATSGGDGGRGKNLALHGDWSANVPACAACHGLRGLGVGSNFPALAGQGAAYLAAQLRAWKDHARHDDPMGLMGAVAGRLDEGQIAAVSAYYAALPPRGSDSAKEVAP